MLDGMTDMLQLLPATILIALRLGVPFIEYRWHQRALSKIDNRS